MLQRRACGSRFLIAVALFGVLAGPAAGDALAQAWPVKTVRIIVPASAGGASDLVARTLAPALAEQLGQPFIVENKPGAGGIIGTQQVAQAAPDGHTLLVTFDTIAINPFLFKNLQWDPFKDFAPVMLLTRYPQVLFVHPSLGVKTVREFVALAKKKGASMNFGSAGPAASSRLAFELFKDEAGIEMVGIHYKGGGPAMQDLIAGQVQVMLIQGSGTTQQTVKAGKLVALAVSSLSRSPSHPDLPTIAEVYPGFETQSWVGMYAPAGTPPAVIERLGAALNKVFADRAMKERFDGQGAEIAAGSPEVLTRLMKADQIKWGKIIRDKKITAE
jgi:tripartite-type tricarboxylate transporter receptor subunit TctC